MKKNLLAITAIVSCLTFSGFNAYAMPGMSGMSEEEHKPENTASLKPTKEIVEDGVKFIFYVFNIDNINQSLKADKNNFFYSCSMHPYVTSEHPGNCGICGMKLEKTVKTDSLISTKDGNLRIQVVLSDPKTGEMIDGAKVKIKLIAPDKKEQEKMMDDKMIIFSSSFSINQKGEYGVIVLVKVGDKDTVAKFFYENN